jgi:hypothetical protein
MGYLPQSTPEMGEYHVEVRGESFYLSGEPNSLVDDEPLPCPSGCTVLGEHKHGTMKYQKARHAIVVYPVSSDVNQGSVEILLEDIPKVRAALDVVERVASGEKGL